MVGPEVWLALWLDVGPEVRSDQKYGRTRSMVSVMVEPGGRTRSMVGPDLWSDQKYGWNRFIAPEKNMVGPLWRNHNYGQI